MPKWKLPGQTSTVIDANTPEKREILFDLTNNRPRIGDGSTAGGKALAFQSETEALSPGSVLAAYHGGGTPSANGLSLVTAANYAAMKALLDLEIGTDVQAYDADTAKLDVAQNWSAGQTLLSDTANFNFQRDDAATDAKRWSMRVGASGTWDIVARTDASPDSGGNSALKLFRSGNTVTEFEVNATNIDINGAVDISGATTCGPVSATTSADAAALTANNSNGSLSTGVAFINAARASNSAFSHLFCTSNNLADIDYNLRGDGNAYSDVAWNGGGADYAEYFEWADGNPFNEDRRGISVVLVGEKIRPATHADDPASIIGVVSAMPTVVGDAGWNKWSGKYLKDEYGAYITEPYSAITWVWTSDGDDAESVTHCYVVGELPVGLAAPEDAIITSVDDKGRPLMRRKLNPAYDPDKPYTPREERPEWSAIGLMGKLFVRKGQPVGTRWIKLDRNTENVERWLVR